MSWKRITNAWNANWEMGVEVTRVRLQSCVSAWEDIAIAFEEYDFVRAVIEGCVLVALSPRCVEEPSYNGEELCWVKNCVNSVSWEQCTIPTYVHVKDELCTGGQLLLRETKIVVSKTCETRK